MQLLHSPRSITLINAPYGFCRSSSLLGQAFRLNSDVKCPRIRTFGSLDARPQSSGGYWRLRVKAAASSAESKDQNVVFVAGATGKVGSRTVRELLKLGNQVRAGVHSAQRAESLVQSVKKMKLDADASGSTPPIERLELVECDLEKKEQIRPALGNASTVICCIGASEKEIFDVTGPYRIDYLATKNLIDAATSAKVDLFILLTSLGTNKVGWPAAILNLFWGVLCWKRKAEEALLASGLSYTIVRPGGMERPTDSYKETHNLVLAEEDTRFGGQVSNLQVAELLAYMAKNPILSCCKVVEVIAETTSPLTPMGGLLTKIPSQRSCEGKFSKKEAVEEVRLQPGNNVPKSLTTEIPSAPVKQVSTETRSSATQPLSPYIAYEGLKPPTSPSPTPSTGSATPIPTVAPSPEKPKHFSSPYASYEDLKPPTSPTPTPSTGSATHIPTVAPSPEKPKHFSSPYASYEDLKPPTSPTPTPSSSSVALSVPAASTGVAVGPPSADKHSESKATPLSPYTMYEDMKPPASPSPRKL